MSGLVFCRYWDFSGSARVMMQHEPSCANNPAAVPPAPPPKPDHVASDHFFHLFDRHAEGEPRLRAATEHCTMLYNSLQDEKALRLASYRDIMQRLADANPLTELALSLYEAVRDMEDD